MTCEKGTIRSSGFEVPETSNFGYRTVVRLPSPDNSTLNIPNASPPSCFSRASRIQHLVSRIPNFKSRSFRLSRSFRQPLTQNLELRTQNICAHPASLANLA